MKYFAYGSNMYTKRLRERVPSASFDTSAALPGHVLRFNKRSQDGSGKCNIVQTGIETDEVRGGVFDIDEDEKPDLDAAEGLNHGYNQRTIRVHTGNGSVEIFTYVADPAAIDDSLQPYTWYKDFVVAGAKEHSFPAGYVRMIESVPAKVDSNKRREEQNRAVLSGS